jgi:hypothetical protein
MMKLLFTKLVSILGGCEEKGGRRREEIDVDVSVSVSEFARLIERSQAKWIE